MRRNTPDDASWEELWSRACARDEAAWTALCERLKNVAWKKINGFRNLSEDDRRDVFAKVFFLLYNNIERIEQPTRLPGWVAKTAYHESIQMLRRRQKDVPVEDVGEQPAQGAGVDERLLADERRAAVRAALLELSERCQQLLGYWSAGFSQRQMVAAMSMPQGAIGPNVRRCLDRLKRLLADAI